MILKYRKHVNLVVDLEIGEEVTTAYCIKEAGKTRIIEEIYFYHNCESGVMVKLSGLEKPIDSNWIVKKEQTQLSLL